MRLRPIALPAAIAALALGGLAAPAQAAPEDDEGPFVGVLIPEQIAVIDGKTKTVRADVLNIGPETVQDVVVSFTNVDPAGRVRLEFRGTFAEVRRGSGIGESAAAAVTDAGCGIAPLRVCPNGGPRVRCRIAGRSDAPLPSRAPEARP